MNLFLRRARLVGFTAALLLCAGITTAPAMAASVPITFTFTGTVTYVGREMGPDFPNGPFRVDKPVDGLYTFNPDTPNTGSGSTGEYINALTGLNVKIGTYNGTYVATLGSGDNKIVVTNPSGVDSIGESYKVEGKFSGSPVTGHNPGSFKLELVNSSSNQFGDDSLPRTPPTLSAFAVRKFRLVFAHGVDEAAHTVIVKVNDLTMVPLPPAVILFGAGLVALIGLGARNWRKQGSSVA